MQKATRKPRGVAHDKSPALEDASAKGVGLEVLEYECSD